MGAVSYLALPRNPAKHDLDGATSWLRTQPRAASGRSKPTTAEVRTRSEIYVRIFRALFAGASIRCGCPPRSSSSSGSRLIQKGSIATPSEGENSKSPIAVRARAVWDGVTCLRGGSTNTRSVPSDFLPLLSAEPDLVVQPASSFASYSRPEASKIGVYRYGPLLARYQGMERRVKTDSEPSR
jgi:hypothetical protein